MIDRNHQWKNVTCSAPSKVMLCGSYVVLYGGESAVVTTSARFYVSVALQSRLQIQRDFTVQLPSVSSPSVFVHSPQFDVIYPFTLLPPSHDQFFRIEGPTNAYITMALRYVLMWQQASNADAYITLLNHMTQTDDVLYIRVDGANDFYSQREHLKMRKLPLTPASLLSLPPFLPVLNVQVLNCFQRNISSEEALTCHKVKKTGLGSSAALVTAFVGALAEFLGLITLRDKSGIAQRDNTSRLKDLNYVHHVAQLVHCVAQGKIGSGFDISAAVFGSQIYRQFSKEMLSTFIDLPLSMQRTQFLTLLENLMRVTVSNHTPFTLPPGLELALGDVEVGADTVSMVKQVQLWASAFPEQSNRLFNDLQSCNHTFIQTLCELSGLYEKDKQFYQQELSAAAQQTYDEWKNKIKSSVVCATLCRVREAFEQIRLHLRELGTVTKVPIEPPPQTTLLDKTISLPGVVCAGVPGAGGYDAVFALCIAESLSRLQSLWSEVSVCTLLARADNRGLEMVPFLAHLLKQNSDDCHERDD